MKAQDDNSSVLPRFDRPALFGLLLLGSLAGFACDTEVGASYPNVLLIIDDQHSRRALGVSGNPIVRTPRLDQLAAEGAWFSQAYCNDPICGPSRFSMFSSLYPSETGAIRNGVPLVEGIKLLPEYLSELGFFTGSAGKNHFADKEDTHGFQELHPHTFYGTPSDSPFTAWFEDRFGERGCEGEPYFWRAERGWMDRLDGKSGLCTINPHPADLCMEHWTTERALDLMRQAKEEDRPFFVQASYLAPHHPYGPLQEFYDLYADDEMVLPESWSQAKIRNNEFTAEEFKVIMRHYYAYVSQVDHYIGELLDGLDDLGLREDTLVIMVSDHGDMMGEFGRLFKGVSEEGSLGIPFFIRWPGHVRGGVVADAPVSLIDVLPTIFDALDLSPLPTARGSSLLPLINGMEDPLDRVVYAMDLRAEPFLFLTVRDWRWKLTIRREGAGKLGARFYDMKNDPWELRDLAKDPAVRAPRERLRAMLSEFWMEQQAARPTTRPVMGGRGRRPTKE